MRAMAFPPEMQYRVLGPETRAEAVTVGALTPTPLFTALLRDTTTTP